MMGCNDVPPVGGQLRGAQLGLALPAARQTLGILPLERASNNHQICLASLFPPFLHHAH